MTTNQPTKNEEKNMLMRRFAENMDFKKVKAAFAKYIGSFMMWFIDKKEYDKRAVRNQLCKVALSNERNENACLLAIDKIILSAEESKDAEVFECPFKRHGFCIPLVDESEVIGYLITCHLKARSDKELVELVSYLAHTSLKDIKKGIELDNLYKTVKPRVVALSTVHTIHRLITSSLYLDELLSRIARLSMQIIRANRCSIKLIDSKRKVLLPKATVDLRTKKARLKKVKIGKWAPGKAFKYAKSIRGEKFLATPLIDEDVIGVITLYDKLDNQPFTDFDEEIMKTLAEQAAIAIKNAQLYREQEKLTMGGIKALAQIIESKGAGLHIPKSCFLRVIHLIGQEFRMNDYDLKALQYAMLLHDAGELMIPEKLLRKKGKLTDKEFRLIKEHPLKGAKIIKTLKLLKPIVPTILYHHENYDGTGYPKGLKAAEIPLSARIVAVVAAFEAMVTRRPYRIPFTIPKAVEEIRKNSGKQFDPKVVQIFLKIVSRKDTLNLLRKELYGSKKNIRG